MTIACSFGEIRLLLCGYHGCGNGNFCMHNAQCGIIPYTRPYTTVLELCREACGVVCLEWERVSFEAKIKKKNKK